MDSKAPGVFFGSDDHEGDDEANKYVSQGQGDDEHVESLASELLGLQDDWYQDGVCQEDQEGQAQFDNVMRCSNNSQGV